MSRYVAFFSYSSVDRRIGELLHSELERFRIPGPLIGRENPMGRLGRRLGPIFRDRSDLAASGNLGRALRQELADARHLIVLCTPASAASLWVNAEIAAFQELGRSDAIIAVLGRGLPRRYDPALCPEGAFPPALLAHGEAEPFAPDMRTVEEGGDGLEMARLKVISALIGIPLAELTQRHVAAERARRRQATGIAAAMIALAIGASVAGTLAWQQSEQANARLIDAVETAAKQVETAAQFRDRFGVSTTVLAELYDGAARDFKSLATEAAEAPRLRLAQLRLSLGLAGFARQAQEKTVGSATHLTEARAALDALEAPAPWAVRLRLMNGVNADELAVIKAAYLKALSLERLRSANFSEAVATAEQALETVGLPSGARLSALCHLAEIRYRADDLEEAEHDSRTCVATARARVESTKNEADTRVLVAELADHARVLRALLRYDESLEVQAEAAERASALASLAANDLLVAATVYHAHLLYGDALTAARRIDAARPAYETARAIAARASAGNPTRTDWKRNHALVLERLASVALQSICSLPAAERLELFALAKDQISTSVDLTKALLKIDPSHPVWLRDLSAGLQVQSELFSNGAAAAGHWPDTATAALDAAKEVVALRETLWKNSPNDIRLQNLAAAQSTLALISARSGAAAVETLFAQAQKTYDTLLATNSRDLWHAERLTLAGYFAKFLIETGRPQEAQAMITDALREARVLSHRHPNTPFFQDLTLRLPTFLDTPHLGESPC